MKELGMYILLHMEVCTKILTCLLHTFCFEDDLTPADAQTTDP